MNQNERKSENEAATSEPMTSTHEQLVHRNLCLTLRIFFPLLIIGLVLLLGASPLFKDGSTLKNLVLAAGVTSLALGLGVPGFYLFRCLMAESES